MANETNEYHLVIEKIVGSAQKWKHSLECWCHSDLESFFEHFDTQGGDFFRWIPEADLPKEDEW